MFRLTHPVGLDASNHLIEIRPLVDFLPEGQHFVQFRFFHFVKQAGQISWHLAPKRRPNFPKPQIECINFQQQLEDNEVVQGYFPAVEQRLRLIFDDRYQSRPARVGKLLVEKVLLEKVLLTNQDFQQLPHVRPIQQQAGCPFCPKKTRQAGALHFPQGLQKPLVPNGKTPDGDALVEVAVEGTEEVGVHHRVEVHPESSLPKSPQCPDEGFAGWRKIFFQQQVLPFGHFFYSLALG